jgi:mannitol/fructose-specific phosphotransferase system IIA component (Ntr-type)
VELSQFLAKRDILIDPAVTTRDELLTSLVTHLLKAHPALADADVLARVMARERQSPTVIGDGLALPHCLLGPGPGWIGGRSGPAVAVARLSRGVDFGGPDGEPVDLVFLIVAGAGDRERYLRTLARLSRVLRDPRTRAALRRARSRDEILGLLRRRNHVLEET